MPTESANVKNQSGTILTCSNADCPCRLRIDEPCPHGSSYTCACGHRFVEADTNLSDMV